MSAGRLKVLFVIPTLTGGGAERVVVTLLNQFDRAQFDLTLAVVDMRNAAFTADIPSDIRFVDLQCLRVRQALPRMARLIWRLRPDVVMSTLGHLNLALALIRGLLPRRTRFIARETTVVSHGITEYRRPGLWAAAYRLLYRRFDRVICQSREMRDDLVAHYRVDEARTTVINNPVDRERIAALAREALPPDALPAGSGPLLVAAGRLVQTKGFDTLIEAMATARNRNFRLAILGEGPLLDELQALALARGVADRVRFVGFQRNPFAWLARADAFVLSSRYEGFPNVVLEALACGTPVIALPAPGGLREILDGVHGCTVASDMSAAALAVALDAWQPQRIPATAVARFSLDRIVGRYAAALSAVPDASGSGRAHR